MGTDEGISNGPKEVVVDLIAGSLGAIASVYVGQPMDTLKVKMQTFPLALARAKTGSLGKHD